MYKKILVPLDGSKLAECALPHAEELAKGSDKAEIVLVSVTERVQGYKAVEGSTEPFVMSGGGWMGSIQPTSPNGHRFTGADAGIPHFNGIQKMGVCRTRQNRQKKSRGKKR